MQSDDLDEVRDVAEQSTKLLHDLYLLSSVVERFLDMEEVASPILAAGTILNDTRCPLIW